ncbi:MAG TPA: sulfur carrier protein ThiS [Pyrinomonadaceae bacterium]|nr:sulfur carrier protein ThiS [Pyrinomonadaceae bacterium]
MVSFQFNGEVREVPEKTDLTRMIELFTLPPKRVAIEVNGEVVRRAQWSFVFVNPQDKIEVVHFVGGG